jgi:dipeptidyl aminopeptidase/acylaminoacyl peptidase
MSRRSGRIHASRAEIVHSNALMDSRPLPFSPRDLVFNVRRATDASIAPDGRRALFSLSCLDAPESSLHHGGQLCVLDLSSSEVRIFGNAEARLSQAAWSPDGHRIGAKALTECGEDLVVTDSTGSWAQGRYERVAAAQAIGKIVWSPDQRMLAFTAHFDPDASDDDTDTRYSPRVTDRIDYKCDGFGWLGNKRSHLYVVPSDGGEPKRLTRELREHAWPAWSPDGTLLAVSERDWATQSARLLIVDGDGKLHQAIGNEPWVIRAWAWSPHGDRLLFAGNDHWTFHSEFFIYDLASKTVRQITSGLDIFIDDVVEPTIGDASQPIWLDEQNVLISGSHRGHSGLYQLALEQCEMQTIAEWPALHTDLSTDASRERVLQIAQNTQHAGDLVLTDLPTRQSRYVTDFNAELLKTHITPEIHRVSAQSGGHEIDGWIVRDPSLKPGMRVPLILWVHGGPESHTGPQWHDDWQYLATNGYAVLAVNPRGSTSYGEHFVDAVIGDWGSGPFADLEAVLDEALNLEYIDQTSVGIMGASYGSYMTGWATSHSNRFDAAITKSVTFDLASQYLSSDFDHAYGDHAWGGPPYNHIEKYSLQSPSTYAADIRTPTLIMQGEADETTPLNQAEQLFRILKKTGCVARFVRYPGGWHGFHRSGQPKHREDSLRRTLEWFDLYLRQDG